MQSATPDQSHARWLVWFDGDGRQQAIPIEDNCYVMTLAQFLMALRRDPELKIERADLIAFIDAAVQRVRTSDALPGIPEDR